MKKLVFFAEMQMSEVCMRTSRRNLITYELLVNFGVDFADFWNFATTKFYRVYEYEFNLPVCIMAELFYISRFDVDLYH